MQNAHLELKEIIWEITGKCNNNCSYCGSLEIKNSDIYVNKIIEIAKAISLYPPKEINISGGDPLLVSYETHENIVNILHDIKNKKILISPNSLISSNGEIKDKKHFDIIKLYDWVGVSINNEKELEKFKLYKKTYGFQNYTVITNFNIQNLYDFELIESFVKQENKFWTLQFTMYENQNNPLAIYSEENHKAFEQLQKKYSNSKANIILSDNLNGETPCFAGLNALGITYDGTIVPCLSMRSWDKKLEEKNKLNITKTPLEEIWKFGFDEQRFSQFECCKDSCSNKCLKHSKKTKKENDIIGIDAIEEIQKSLRNNPYRPISPSDRTNIVMMYGVFNPEYRNFDKPILKFKDNTSTDTNSEI
jgi:MoaA/NifB/PqqE/SkfB family radical SAM enzyme